MKHPLLDEYERETRPSPGSADRAAATAVRRHLSPAPRRRPLFPVVGAACAAALLVGSVVFLRSAEAPARPEVAVPVPVAETLASTGVPAARTLPSGVTLSWDGVGQLSGGDSVGWEAGTIHVEVPPDQGIRFSVRTREATVKVVGTGFSVSRGALGTAVDVAHGRVEVRCEEEGVVLLGAGERRTCLPTSAAGLLARARALDAAGAGEAEVLAAVDRGLVRADADEEAVVSELRYLRADVAYRAGDLASARADLTRWLADTPTGARRPDALRLAAEIALAAEGCAAALEPLRALVDAGATDEDLARLRECEDRVGRDRSGASRPPGE